MPLCGRNQHNEEEDTIFPRQNRRSSELWINNHTEVVSPQANPNPWWQEIKIHAESNEESDDHSQGTSLITWTGEFYSTRERKRCCSLGKLKLNQSAGRVTEFLFYLCPLGTWVGIII